MRDEDKFGFHYGWIVLAMGTFAIFGALGLARFGYSMILPTMQADLELTNGQAGLLATLSLVGYLALAIIGGLLAARYGVRIVATVGMLMAGAGMVLTGLAHSFLLVTLWSSLTGIGSGAVNVALMGLWPAWFTRQKRGMASGIAVSGSSVGLIFSGLVVPKLINAYGGKAWQIGWWLFGGITIILGIASWLILRNNPADIGLAPIGDTEQPKSGPHREKVHWRSVYFSARVWQMGLVYIAFGFSYIIFMTFFVKHLVADAGFSDPQVGRIFMLMDWFSVFSGLLWGTISDIIGRRNALTALYLIHSLAFCLFGLGSSTVYFILSAFLYGISAWSIPAIMSAACGDLLGPELAPAAVGFITLFFGIGQASGPVIAGMVADAANSFSPVFLMAAVVALLGAAGSALLLRGGRSAGPVVTLLTTKEEGAE